MASKIKDDDTKIFAFLAVFLGIIGFVIALIAKKDNKYVMHYAKQSLVLTIVAFALWIVYMIIAVPLTLITLGFGAIILWPIGMILWVGVVVLWLIGWIYALSGEQKYIPIIGKYGDKFNL